MQILCYLRMIYLPICKSTYHNAFVLLIILALSHQYHSCPFHNFSMPTYWYYGKNSAQKKNFRIQFLCGCYHVLPSCIYVIIPMMCSIIDLFFVLMHRLSCTVYNDKMPQMFKLRWKEEKRGVTVIIVEVK